MSASKPFNTAQHGSVAVLVPCYNEAVTIGKVVDRLPTALLAVALVLMGMLSLISGLILDTVVKGARKQYELTVIDASS